MFALVLHRCRHPHTVFRDSQWFHFDIYRNVFPSCCYWSIAAVTVSLGLSWSIWWVIKTNCNYFIVIKATVRLGTARQKYTGWHFNCSVAHITILLLVPLWNILKLLQCVYFFFIIIFIVCLPCVCLIPHGPAAAAASCELILSVNTMQSQTELCSSEKQQHPLKVWPVTYASSQYAWQREVEHAVLFNG